MKGGDANAFVDRIYSCQDTVYIYDHVKYWFQGYMPTDNKVHMEIFQYEPPGDRNIWEYDGSSLSEAVKSFLGAKIFNGKTFWQAEKDIQWVDF